MPKHVLLIVADQHRYDALSCAGHELADTPRLDALAVEGVRFTHCHSPAPVCVPARAAMLSGRHPHETGVYSNGEREALDDARFPSFGHVMRDHGITPHAIGRTHMMHHGCKPTNVLPGRSWPDPYGGPYGGRCLGKAPVELEEYWDVRIARAGITRLREAKASDEPTCVWVNLQMPHPPFVLPEPYYSQAEALWPQLAPPRPPKGYFDDRPAFLRAFWEQQLAHLPDEHLQRMKAYYYAACGVTDYAVGMLLDALDELGMRDETLVMYTGDHGDVAGDHGLFSKGAFQEGSVRVPLICRWPGAIEPGQTCDHLVSLIDIGRSMLEALGVDDPRPGPGRSLWPALRGEAQPRSHVLASSGTPGGDHFGYMARNHQWKLARYADGFSELYDVANDPAETVNRADDPATRDVQHHMQGELLTNLLATLTPPCVPDEQARAAQRERLSAETELLESEGHEQRDALEACDPAEIVRL